MNTVINFSLVKDRLKYLPLIVGFLLIAFAFKVTNKPIPVRFLDSIRQPINNTQIEICNNDTPATILEPIFDVIVWHIKLSEGFRAKKYFCPAGYLTIGYGYRINKPQNFHLEKISEKDASYLLHESLETKIEWVRRELLPARDGWTRQEQLAVALLAYNCRMSSFKNSGLWSAIQRYKKEGRPHELKNEVAYNWLKWSLYKDRRTGKMKTSIGLQKRREFEVGLFLHGKEFIDQKREPIRKALMKKMKTSPYYIKS